jgi:seryl-tRNA synthetase
MADERLINQLQQQLTEAHTRLGEYSQKVMDLSKHEAARNAMMVEQETLEMQRNRALAQKNAAEENAAAGQRVASQAASKVRGLEDQLERVEAERDRGREEIARLVKRNGRIERARSVEDLFGEE